MGYLYTAVGQRENVFFSRPAVKPSDDEKVALSEFIKGRYSLPSMFLTSKRLSREIKIISEEEELFRTS